MKPLPFEEPIDELYAKIEELKQLSDEGQVDLSSEIKRIEERAEKMRKEVFANLKPSQIIQIARISQLVEIDYMIIIVCIQNMPNKMAANKSSTTSNENSLQNNPLIDAYKNIQAVIPK